MVMVMVIVIVIVIVIVTVTVTVTVVSNYSIGHSKEKISLKYDLQVYTRQGTS